METTLYAKYCSLRRPEFRTVTEIRENESEKYVLKRPANPAAWQQMDRLKKNCALLEDYYIDIQVIPMSETEEGIAFPFINGKTLEEVLMESWTDQESFVRKTNEMIDRVLSVKEKYKTVFQPSAGFTEIFGETELAGVPAFCPANVDPILSNYIISSEKTFCFDYEWVFDFSVPVDFLRYRILKYLNGQQYIRRNNITEEAFLEWFGFSKADQEKYAQMDNRFQQYVHGDGHKYFYLLNYIKGDRENNEIRRLTEQYEMLNSQYQGISNAFFWKITKPARVVLDAIKKKTERTES